VGTGVTFSPLSKRVAILAAIGAAIWILNAQRTQKDFNECHLQALDFINLMNKTDHYPPQAWHDLVDEHLHECMLAKGYSYDPTGWEKCPTEKLGMCYRGNLQTFF
jgi:hypothetical protein